MNGLYTSKSTMRIMAYVDNRLVGWCGLEAPEEVKNVFYQRLIQELSPEDLVKVLCGGKQNG